MRGRTHTRFRRCPRDVNHPRTERDDGEALGLKLCGVLRRNHVLCGFRDAVRGDTCNARLPHDVGVAHLGADDDNLLLRALAQQRQESVHRADETENVHIELR